MKKGVIGTSVYIWCGLIEIQLRVFSDLDIIQQMYCILYALSFGPDGEVKTNRQTIIQHRFCVYEMLNNFKFLSMLIY